MLSLQRCFQYSKRVFYTFPFFGEKARITRHTILNELYNTVNQYLNDLNVEYYMTYGTLLGYFRDGAIISHDKDVDFAVSEKHLQMVLDNKSKIPRQFKLYTTTHLHLGPKLAVNYKGFDADIYFFNDDSNILYPYTKSKYMNDMKPIPRELVYPVKKTSFLGQKTYIPNQTEAYLKFIYHEIDRNAKQDKKTGYWYLNKT